MWKRYGTKLFKNIAANIESDKETKICRPKRYLVSIAWNDVTSKSISNRFRKLGSAFESHDDDTALEQVASADGAEGGEAGGERNGWQFMRNHLGMPQSTKVDEYLQCDATLTVNDMICRINRSWKVRNDNKHTEPEKLLDHEEETTDERSYECRKINEALKHIRFLRDVCEL